MFDYLLKFSTAPKKNLSSLENFIILFSLRKRLSVESKQIDLQQPLAKRASFYASMSTKFLSSFMPNNLGNWTKYSPHSISTQLEKQAIEIIKNYYQANKNINGYLSSGSTEGNIYATWLGRNFLHQKLKIENKKICLLKSSLAHYSIDKAADLTDVEVKELAINKKEWNIDLNYLENTLELSYQNNYRGFLLPITLGYTVTGTEDNLDGIAQIIENFKKKHPEAFFFVWLDAAFNGISKNFTQKKFRPFENKCIQLITTDLHKLLRNPYSSGLILYRKGLDQYISRKIPYIENILDTTLLGSRSGILAITSWFNLINLNKNKLEKLFLKARLEKESFIKEIIKEKEIKVEVINNPYSVQACLVHENKKSARIVKEKFKLNSFEYQILFPNGKKRLQLSKLFFLPKF